MRTTPRAPRALAVLVLLGLAAGCAPAVRSAPAAPTTVYVVRHAERASESDRDSPLSAAGEARARALADALAESGIAAAYVTQYRRTRDTAAPLAERLGIPVRADSIPRGGAEQAAAALARTLRARHAGEAVLVVGHSNTVPLIVRALGGPELEQLPAERYGDLFIVILPPAGPVRTVKAQFGMDG